MCVLTIAIAMLAAGTARAAAVKATLSDVKGAVSVRQADGDYAPAKTGMTVADGVSIKTGADGSAILKWGGHTAKIAPLTVVKVSSLKVDDKGVSESKLNLSQGRVVSKVGKLDKGSAFMIETPVAVAGVRGTAFETGMDPETNQATVAVVEGDVSVMAAGVEIMVAAGFESAIMTGAAPEQPTEIPADRMQELKTTVDEMKTEAEETAAPAENGKTVETIIDDTIQKQTIDNKVMDDALNNACPAGGGCIKGTITLE